MAFRQLKGFAREIYLDEAVEELAKVYAKSRNKLTGILSQVDITDFQKKRTELLLSQVNDEIRLLNKRVKSWTNEAILQAYEGGLDLAEPNLKALKLADEINYDARIHKGAVVALIDDVATDLITANATIKNKFNRFFRATQQKIIEDKQINRLIAEGVIQGQTRRQVSNEILQALTKEMQEGKFITINGRKYEPASYSRLLARTRFIEAANQASINASLQYGADLIQVSVHHHPYFDRCLQFQGKIFSISGTDPDFPPLVEKPPYHPNCKHFLVAITREALEDRGQLDGSIRFSNTTAERGAESFKDFEEKVHV